MSPFPMLARIECEGLTMHRFSINDVRFRRWNMGAREALGCAIGVIDPVGPYAYLLFGQGHDVQGETVII